MQSLEDSQAFIDLFPTCYSPTLTAVNKITSKLSQIESNGDQCLNEQVLCFQKVVVEYVAFIQVDKYIGDDYVINYWFLNTAPVSDQSNQQ